MTDHIAFGLRVRAAVSLPGLVECPRAGEPDVELEFGLPTWHDAPRVRAFSSELNDAGEPVVVVWSLPSVNALVLEYAEGMRFHLTSDGSRVWADWKSPLTLADTMTFVVGPVLGYALRRRGVLALHASSVRIGEHAVAFVGPGGAGKSTLATACAQAGHPLVTDDILVLHERDAWWWTVPAPDQVRLWEDSERILFGAGSALPALTPNWAKRGLKMEAAGFDVVKEAVPLGLVLLLAARAEDPSAPRIEAVRGGDALLELVTNSYANYLLDAAERAAELRAVGRLASSVPVRRLVPHADAARLAETVTMIARYAKDPTRLPSAPSVPR
ncbi:MAG: hypothetical protein ACKVS7_09065 [Gemmatimonadaceae bacterium]